MTTDDTNKKPAAEESTLREVPRSISDEARREDAPDPKAEGGHGEEAVPRLIVKPVWTDPLTGESMDLTELRRALEGD